MTTISYEARLILSPDIFDEKFLSPSDQVNFRSQKLVQGGLDLIEATNTCSTPEAQEAFFPARGARSLQAMCCKRYARRVVELEYEQENEISEEKFDVATEAYELLDETFGTGGAEYMRAMTREYGLATLERMLMTSYIKRSHAIALLRRIRRPQRSQAKHSSSAEAESLLATLYKASTPDARCCSKDNTFAHTLNTLAEVSYQLYAAEQVEFELRQFQVLLKSSMPLCWLGSRRLTALWTCTFRVLLGDNRSAGAVGVNCRAVESFLETFVALDFDLEVQAATALDLANSSAVPDYHGNALGCPRCPKAPPARFLNAPKLSQPHCATNNSNGRQRLDTSLYNSISSLFAILASFILASRHKPDGLGPPDYLGITSMFTRLSMSVIQGLARSRRSSAEFPHERGSAILSATLLVLLGQQTAASGASTISINDLIQALTDMDRKARTIDSSTGTLALVPEFILSTILSIGKLVNSAGYEVLEFVVASLKTTSRSPQILPPSAAFLQDLAIASAELFSERFESGQGFELARTLKAEFHGVHRPTGMATPFQATPEPDRYREGLKWEDSIGEWVESTSPGYSLPNIAHSMRERSAVPIDLFSGRDSRQPALYSETGMLTASDHLSFGFPGGAAKNEKHDSGILSLLLSSSSPIKDELSLSLSTESTKPSSQNCSLTRRPLADRTNFNDAIPLASNSKDIVAKCSELKPARIKLKRSHTDIVENSSDDELDLPMPRRRCHGKRETVFRSTQLDRFNSAEEDSSILSSTSSDVKSRRRPRGTALRSLHSKRPTLSRSMSMLKQGCGVLDDSDDELSFSAR